MQAAPGDADANPTIAERLVCRAFRQGAEWAILPEFFTAAVFHPAMLDAARRLDGAPARLLQGLARKPGGAGGGSFAASPCPTASAAERACRPIPPHCQGYLPR